MTTKVSNLEQKGDAVMEQVGILKCLTHKLKEVKPMEAIAHKDEIVNWIKMVVPAVVKAVLSVIK